MKKPVIRRWATILLMLMYINRGFFISSVEVESPDGEVNSVVEWVVLLITGHENGIDEDGDVQSDCNVVQIVHYDFSQQLAQTLELVNLFSKEITKTAIPNKETLPTKDFYSRIDHPPENC
jgi:hypothetical protein